MARPKKNVPDYCFHAVSGQAVVKFNGKPFYLGPFNTPESLARYHALCAEYVSSGQQTPAGLDKAAEPKVTVSDVAGCARDWAGTKYAKNPAERSKFISLADLLSNEFGNEPAEQFGPVKLDEIRQLLLKGRGRGSSEAGTVTRRYVNEQVRRVVRIFKLAVSKEQIDASVYAKLESLEPLRAGEGGAESKDVMPVSLNDVARTIPYLSPTLQAMVRVQLGTAMRPSEVMNLRPCEIDKSGKVWFYRPASHKTANKGKSRAIPIVDDVREVIEPFLDRDPDAFCFSPKESAQWYRDQRSANRKTRPSCGNRVGTNRKENPKREPGEKFTKDSYAKAIKRAAIKAKVAHWFPYQLRHTTATEVRRLLDAESAQALLGHSRLSTTEIYTQRSEAKAVEAARKAPKLERVEVMG